MKQITLGRRNSSGKEIWETFNVVSVGKYGFDLQKPKGRKTYTAIRNQHNRNYVTVLDGRGGKVFAGLIMEIA